MRCEKCGAEVDDTGFCQRCMTMVAGVEDEQAPESESRAAEPPASQRTAATGERKAPSRSDPEVELWTGRYSSRAMLGTWIILAVLTVAFIALGGWMIGRKWVHSSAITWGILLAIPAILWLYFFCVYLWRRWTIKYRLTTYRFFSEKGLIWHSIDTLEVINIDDIRLERNLWERIVGVGKVIIHSTDASDPELVVFGIDKPREAFEKIDAARRDERIRRGVNLVGEGSVFRGGN